MKKRILVIYPGRFQPFHKGHKKVFDTLKKRFKKNVYIATSNKVDPPKSPFDFAEKKQMMELTGMDTDNVVLTKNPYLAHEITQHFDKDNTVLIFAVSKKDMADDPRFSFKPKKDGSPSYFQPYKNIASSKPMSEHGYILTVPTYEFDVLGKPVTSATQLRDMYSKLSDKKRKQFIKDLFGTYDKTVKGIMDYKLENLEKLNERVKRLENLLEAWREPYKYRGITIDKDPDLPRDPDRYRVYGGVTGIMQKAIPMLRKMIDELNELNDPKTHPSKKKIQSANIMTKFYSLLKSVEQAIDAITMTMTTESKMKKIAETKINNTTISIWEADGKILAVNAKTKAVHPIKNVVTESMDIITMKNAAGKLLRIMYDKLNNTTTIRDERGGSHSYQRDAKSVINALQKKGYKVAQDSAEELSLVPMDNEPKVRGSRTLPGGGYEMNLMNSKFCESYGFEPAMKVFERDAKAIANKLSEKWNKEVDTPKSERGKYKGKTLGELRKMYKNLKKSGPHKKGSKEYEKMKELQFAIRAKTGWGKVE